MSAGTYTQCNDDCEQLKKEKFAQDCKADGGFFKCCIRYAYSDYAVELGMRTATML